MNARTALVAVTLVVVAAALGVAVATPTPLPSPTPAPSAVPVVVESPADGSVLPFVAQETFTISGSMNDSQFLDGLHHMTSAYFIGDSILDGSPTFAEFASARLGWPYSNHPESVGGSGYLALGSGTNFINRLSILLAAAPDIVVVEGGHNDTGYPIDQFSAAVNTFYTSLHVGLPNATVYVCAPWYTAGASLSATLAEAAVLKSVAAAHGYTYIDWLNPLWITGTGYVGHEAGDGNADVYIGDGVHPTAAGSAYVGVRLAHAINPPSTEFRLAGGDYELRWTAQGGPSGSCFGTAWLDTPTGAHNGWILDIFDLYADTTKKRSGVSRISGIFAGKYVIGTITTCRWSITFVHEGPLGDAGPNK